MQRKILARIPRPKRKAETPPTAAPPVDAPAEDTSLIAEPLKAPFKLPALAPTTAYMVLPVLVFVALAAGWLAGSSANPLLMGLAVGIGLVLVATSIVVGMMLARSVVNTVAPLFMTRYGLSERERAQELISSMLSESTMPAYRIVQGEIRDDMNSDLYARYNGVQSERRRELFRTSGYGPARLYLDSESAALIEREGKFQVIHAGMHDITASDRLKGVAHLRPQRESFDLKGLYTRDMVPLDLKGSISFQIKQDARHLEQTQTHHVDVEVLRRALLPRDEWRSRTKAQIPLQINAILRECELWQIFLAPPKPPAPGEIATLYTLGQSVLPTGTRFELESRLKSRLNEVCWKWGVEINRVSIEQVVAPRDLSEAAYRTYMQWNQNNEQSLEQVRQAELKLRLAQSENEQIKLRQESEILHAETEKRKEILQAEGDAASYEKRMKARADGALEFARRIETLRQAMGSTLDEGTFRELLRALEMLREDERDEYERDGYSRLLLQARDRRTHE